MKFLDRTSGLDLYDFEARAYDPAIGRFRQPDPLTEEYQPLSPYLYCAANPLIMADPTGESTFVVKNPDDGTYRVVGGELNDDKTIYEIKNGFVSEAIGATTSITSFYDSDKDVWCGNIDPNDHSGETFLNLFMSDPPSLENYIINARNNKFYDFKCSAKKLIKLHY